MNTHLQHLRECQAQVNEWIEQLTTLARHLSEKSTLLPKSIKEIKAMEEQEATQQLAHEVLYSPLIRLHTSLINLDSASHRLPEMEEIKRIQTDMEALLANLNIHIDYYLYQARDSSS